MTIVLASLCGCSADRWDIALTGSVYQVDQHVHRKLREAYKTMDLDQILAFYTLDLPASGNIHDHPIAKRIQSTLDRFDKIEYAWVSLRPPTRFNDPAPGLVTSFTRTTIWGTSPEGYLSVVIDGDLVIRATQDSATIVEERIIDTRFVARKERTFTDVTVQAGITFINEAVGLELESSVVTNVTPASGAACGDIDNDGYEDLYLVNGRGDRLYRNLGDGTFEDITEKAGLAHMYGDGQSAIFGDLDNDGDADLFITNLTAPNQVFRNNGDATFTEMTETANLPYSPYNNSLTLADYDNDGDLDVFIVGGGDFWGSVPSPIHQAYNGTKNRLLRNNGDWTFTDVTREAGVGGTNWGLAASWSDYDNDGDQDIYVANDFGFNSLYQNQGDGTFRDVAVECGVVDRGAGMGCTWGDYNNDGHMDLFVSNMFSNSEWMFSHPDYPLPALWFQNTLFEKRVRHVLHEMTRGSTLLLNNGDGTFTDVSDEIDIRDTPQWAWGSYFFDYDNDMDQDIYVVNGMISGEQKDDL